MNRTGGYEDTLRGARNIKFVLGECSRGQLTNRVFMTMVDKNAYTGSITKNPFKFKLFRVSQVAIYLNEEMPAPPIKLNFTDNQYIDGYRSLFATAGQINMDNGLDITRADYKSGY